MPEYLGREAGVGKVGSCFVLVWLGRSRTEQSGAEMQRPAGDVEWW